MTDEERQRTMDFILQQQAQFAAEMQRLEEADARASKRLDRLERYLRLMGRRFRKGRNELDERMTALINAQIRSEDKAAGTEDLLKRLEESHARSDERMTRVEESYARSDERMARVEESHARSNEIMARLEESYARSDERMTRVEESQARSEEGLTRLEELTGRNSEDIAALAKVVANMAQRRNGDNGAA